MSRLSILTGVAAVLGLAGVSLADDDAKSLPLKLVTHKVQREKLQPLINERGTLESARNTDIYCMVKAGLRVSSSSIIKWVIDDGSSVKKGDLLLELDDAGLQDQLLLQKLTLDSAEADQTKAAQDLKIQSSQNESDLGTAQLTRQLAELDLERYLKGDRETALQEIKSRLLQAEADVEQWTEVLEQAENKFKEKEATERQVRMVRLRLEAARLVLQKNRLELQVLEKYGRPRTESELRGRVAEAQRALERMHQMAEARDAHARQTLEARKSSYRLEVARYREIEAEIKNCKMYAPQDGMVVYYVPEQVRFSSTQQSIVAQGEPVREGQKLLSIPDLSKMQVVLRVPEAVVTQIRVGHPAVLRVDAFPDRELRGTVRRVATVPSASDWFAADEKTYQTVIAIEGDTTGFRPGMTATGTLSLGKARDNVLTVPARALIGRGAFGKTAACLVLTTSGPEEREVVVGLRNAQLAEITSGLREGEEVIVNPQLFLNGLRDRIRFLSGGRTPPRRGD